MTSKTAPLSETRLENGLVTARQSLGVDIELTIEVPATISPDFTRDWAGATESVTIRVSPSEILRLLRNLTLFASDCLGNSLSASMAQTESSTDLYSQPLFQQLRLKSEGGESAFGGFKVPGHDAYGIWLTKPSPRDDHRRRELSPEPVCVVVSGDNLRLFRNRSREFSQGHRPTGFWPMIVPGVGYGHMSVSPENSAGLFVIKVSGATAADRQLDEVREVMVSGGVDSSGLQRIVEFLDHLLGGEKT